jgi:hypothetical protein
MKFRQSISVSFVFIFISSFFNFVPLCLCASVPVSFHLSFENFDFMGEDVIARSELKTIKDRGITLEEGRFGKGIKMTLTPKKVIIDNMSGIELDMVTAVVFNTRSRSEWDMLTEPFIWGAGKLNTGSGALAFWVKGPLAEGDLFDQSAMAWGRTERFLLAVTVDESKRIGAYLTDSRYVRHTIRANSPVDASGWTHVALNWDKARGLELFVNGVSAASSWGKDSWWETYMPGLMHLPTKNVVYDELYTFTRPLTTTEVSALMKENQPPSSLNIPDDRSAGERDRLAKAVGLSQGMALPALSPLPGNRALSFREITPALMGDEHIQGRFCNDGRYELAWPHPQAVFTFLPGDASFKAEKLDIETPQGVPYNYITLEGNLKGMPSVLQDCRKAGDHFTGKPFFTVPQDDRFFYGAQVLREARGRFTLPFLKGYGAPDGFKGDVHLPITGETRIHEVGLFDVKEVEDIPSYGQVCYYLRSGGETLDKRYDFALRNLFPLVDRTILGGYLTPLPGDGAWFGTGSLRWNHLITAQMTGRQCYGSIILDLDVKTTGPEDILLVRLRDPGTPHRIWTHAEVKLRGFQNGGKLRLRLDPPPLILAAGDVIWIDITTLNNTALRVGGAQGSRIILNPAPFLASEKAFETKALLPVMAQFTKAYHHQPWLFEKIWPDIMDPHALGGQFDSVMPAMAVNRVLPHSRLAQFYIEWASPKYYWGGIVDPVKDFPIKQFDIPSGIPRWAYFQHQIQCFRYRVADWLGANQNPDGEFGGGWDDDAIIYRAKLDMPLESPRVLKSYLKLFEGMDATKIFSKGYCQITPTDALHNYQFVSNRHSALIYMPGDPFIYRRALETAWHLDKPDSTPISWSQGKPFAFDRGVLNWYWGKNLPKQVYKTENPKTLDENLSRLASWLDDFMFYRHTEARIHTDNQVIYNENYVQTMVMGGNADSTVSAGWISGGEEDLSRWVTYADGTAFTCRLFSFDPLPRNVSLRLFRIEPGDYEVKLSEDSDGTAGSGIKTETMTMKRFDIINLVIPPSKPVMLTVKQVKGEGGIKPLPDIAVAAYDCVREGSVLRVRVSNVGAADTENSTLVLYDLDNHVLGEMNIPVIPAPTDFKEKSIWVTFKNVPEKGILKVVADPQHKMKEIYTGNNEAVVE